MSLPRGPLARNVWLPAARMQAIQNRLRANADFTNKQASGLDLSMLQGDELKSFHAKEVVTTNEVVRLLGKI